MAAGEKYLKQESLDEVKEEYKAKIEVYCPEI